MKWYLIIIIIFLSSCDGNRKNSSIYYSPIRLGNHEVDKHKQLIINLGDTNSYNILRIEYLSYEIPEEFLFYSMIMANKYHYPQAYYDVFTNLTNLYYNHIELIDSITANMAIEYLLNASQRGNAQAIEIVKDYSVIFNKKANEEQIKRIIK